MEIATTTSHEDDDMTVADWLDWKIEQGRYCFASQTERLEFEAEVEAQDRGDIEILDLDEDEADRRYCEIWQEERKKRGLV